MTETSNPVALPWYCQKQGWDNLWYISALADNPCRKPLLLARDIEQDKAEQIVRAVNAYDELVATVRDLVDLTERSCPTCEGSTEAHMRGKAILAAVKESSNV